MLCRIAYVCENWSLFKNGWDALNIMQLLRGSLRFDSSAIFYTNALYIVLMLLPLHLKERNWWHTMTKWVFVVVNSLAVAVNLSDAVYSQYTGRRTTATFFDEFGNEGNLGHIFATEMLNHWYLVLAAVAMIALMWLLYVKPVATEQSKPVRIVPYYVVQSLVFLLAFPIAVIAMRGGATRTTRPITISNANQYVNQPHEAAIVLNTPFSVIRTLGKTTFVDPAYFDNETMANIYTPIHFPPDPESTSTSQLYGICKGKNVVVIIIESFAREYVGYYHNGEFMNSCPGIDEYKGYTPFFDSLMEHSLTWHQTYANGRKSIDAMPSILSSIPMFIEPFFTTSYSLNHVSGIAAELSNEGYSSAFFHGADNGSMGFQAFSRATGFQNYYGRFEYDDDPRFGGEKDYDGTWAIWDEPFLQYYATIMNEMPQPFVTSVFTASSHHPYNVPEQYKDIYNDDGLPIYKCIRYTDNALRLFFKTASQQPWFKNTVFVITNDHTNLTNFEYYRSAQGLYSCTLAIFDPSGQLPTGIMPGIAQQIDIMPTLLALLGYQRPYVAFGRNAMDSDNPTQSWTVNYNNGVYQYLENDTLIQFYGEKVLKAYDMKKDPLMKQTLSTTPQWHEKRLKAIIQQYMSRMINDQLTVGD